MKCIVCGEKIEERSHIPYIPRVNDRIIGRGSQNVATEDDRIIDGYHCEKCGLEYHHLPNDK